MIVSYRDKRTRDFAAGKWVRAFSGIERAARLKIDRLEAASSLRDLAALPGNRFHALTGNRELRVAAGRDRAYQCRDRGLSLGGAP